MCDGFLFFSLLLFISSISWQHLAIKVTLGWNEHCKMLEQWDVFLLPGRFFCNSYLLLLVAIWMDIWENFGTTANVLLNQDWRVRILSITFFFFFSKNFLFFWENEWPWHETVSARSSVNESGRWSAPYSNQELFLSSFFNLLDFIPKVTFAAIIKWDIDTGKYMLSCLCQMPTWFSSNS